MADKAAVKDGDKIRYAREDAGGAIGWGKGNAKRGWRLTPGETITAGKDIPLDVCARLVEDGICAIVQPPASTPQPAMTNATPGAAGAAAPGNSASAPAAAATGATTAPAASPNAAASTATPNTAATPAASGAPASPSASSSAVAANS